MSLIIKESSHILTRLTIHSYLLASINATFCELGHANELHFSHATKTQHSLLLSGPRIISKSVSRSRLVMSFSIFSSANAMASDNGSKAAKVALITGITGQGMITKIHKTWRYNMNLLESCRYYISFLKENLVEKCLVSI